MKSLEIKIITFISSIIIALSIGISIGIISAVIYSQENPKVVYCEFTPTEINKNIDWKYKMLPEEYSNYICDLCSQMKVDSDLIVALLMKENPEFDPSATHKNENGTIDCGLGQLNSAYIWSTFKNRYWKFDFELDPFNWKHNLFIMIHHVQYLQSTLKSNDLAIMAYNCGEGNVMNNTIPSVTKYYLASVKNSYRLLKNEE